MGIKLNLIAAACENMGIGLNGDLPWRLKKEMAFFTKMTTTAIDGSKKNAVIMGRKTWESVPKKFKPFSNRINVILSNSVKDFGYETVVCKSVEEAMSVLNGPKYCDIVETAWIIGGRAVYEEALVSPHCNRLYLTRIKKNFDCDTFFPNIPTKFSLVKDESIPQGEQEENGIHYEFTVYQAIR